MSEDNIREKLLAKALKSYDEKYQELKNTWKFLDTKAQGMAAIAGIFIAGTFAFATQIESPVKIWWKILLPPLLLVLAYSIYQCIAAMRLQYSYESPTGDPLTEMVEDLLGVVESDTELIKRIPNFYGDLIRHYKKAVGSIRETLEKKADHTSNAQIGLSIVIIISAVSTFLFVFTK